MAWILIGIIRLWSLIPLRCSQLLRRPLGFILEHVMRYRRKTVEANLLRCFPDKDSAARLQIRKDFYRHFAQQVLEILRSFSYSADQVAQHMVLEDAIFEKKVAKIKRPLFLVFSHGPNWEWGSLGCSAALPHPVYLAYKPLKSSIMDKWLKARRSRFGANLVSMRQLPKTLVQIKDQPSCVLLIVDQNPSNPAHAHGAEFFGQTSAFLSGMARLAVRYQFDIAYIDVKTVKPGKYSAYMRASYDVHPNTKPEEVTQWYAKELEQSLKEEPHRWLWTHKRFKHDSYWSE